MPKGRPKKELVVGNTESVVTVEDTPTMPVVEEVKIVEQKKPTIREKIVIRNGRKFAQSINENHQIISFVEIR
jgi:hypothetical protein